MQTAALCFPKSHRVATERDQSSHSGNSGISAADSVACELHSSPDLNTPAATSMDNQCTGIQASATTDFLCCFVLENFIPCLQKDKG